MVKGLKAPVRDINDKVVMFILLAFCAGAILGAAISHVQSKESNWWAWLDGFFQNFGTEMFGAFLTFLLIEVLLQTRRDMDANRHAEEQEKRRLLLQMGSPDRAFAVEAARLIRQRGWAHDGTLQGANLWMANLEGARLREAVLPDAYMYGCNLRNAHFIGANLQRVDLRDASLVQADLEESSLCGADLRGATLQDADLSKADLREVQFDAKTILPDGRPWSSETDLSRFTNPDHPQFWRAPSPADPMATGPRPAVRPAPQAQPIQGALPKRPGSMLHTNIRPVQPPAPANAPKPPLQGPAQGPVPKRPGSMLHTNIRPVQPPPQTNRPKPDSR